jgi:nicotinamide phosphoribosyltransferase
MIFKDPKTDRESGIAMKKSQKGMVFVYKDEDGKICFKDGYTSRDIPEGNMLKPVFENGQFLKEYTLKEIRDRLHGGKF